MNHQGYTTRIEYDERDALFVGRILGIRSIISFHGETVSELRAAFEHAVEDYLAECAAAGISPEKPASGKFLLRIPPNSTAAPSSPPKPQAKASTSGRPRFCGRRRRRRAERKTSAWTLVIVCARMRMAYLVGDCC